MGEKEKNVGGDRGGYIFRSLMGSKGRL